MLNLRGFLCFIAGLLVMSHVSAQENAMREENQVCLNCHSKQTYSFFNDWSGQDEKRLMNPHLVIDSVMFMNGVHQTFACTDCHSMDYETYPHLHECMSSNWNRWPRVWTATVVIPTTNSTSLKKLMKNFRRASTSREPVTSLPAANVTTSITTRMLPGPVQPLERLFVLTIRCALPATPMLPNIVSQPMPNFTILATFMNGFPTRNSISEVSAVSIVTASLNRT